MGGLPLRAVRVGLLAGGLVAIGLVAGVSRMAGTERHVAGDVVGAVDCGVEPMQIIQLDVGFTPARPGGRRPPALGQRQALRRYLRVASIRIPASRFVRVPGNPRLFVAKADGRTRALAQIEPIGDSWFVKTITACDSDASTKGGSTK